jgi:hypothetical protein
MGSTTRANTDGDGDGNGNVHSHAPPDKPEPSPGHAESASESLTPTPTPTASGSELAAAVRQRRRPIPRKGHTKSRRGCFNCKRRKVKCQENLPECSNCVRFGLVCEYPQTRARSASALAVPAPSMSAMLVVSPPSAPLQSTPTLFTPDDMRFFHHFLLNAYPPLPILADDLWRNVACLSHSVCLPALPTL